jgi:hypothetical protein
MEAPDPVGMSFRTMLLCCLGALFALVLPCVAQDDLTTLRQEITTQQQQIEELKRTLETQQRLLERLATAAAGPSSAAAASTQTPAQAVVASQAKTQAAPLSFRIGEADFTPGGFMDLTSIWRSTNVASGIGTSFSGIPFNNTVAGKSYESRFSAQNSRLTLKVTTNAGSTAVTGYVEADFLGALPANGHVSSNADSLRMRLYWVDLRRGKWEVLGGQSWSMLTPGRTGISPAPSDLFYTQDVDTNYQVGLTWTRAPQFRLVYHANKNWTAGFALENPQQYVGAAVTLPAFASTQVDNNTLTGTPNAHPDVQAKLAYDAKPAGHAFHLETAGVLRTFRIRRTDLSSSTIQGGGAELNGNVELVKNLRLLASSFYSSGGGRYIYGLGPDFIVRPDGALSPVHSGSGIAGFEYQASPKSQFYAYYGTAYYGRNWSTDSAGKYYGYGFPGSAVSNNRTIQEYTIGYTHTFWKSSTFGALQLMNQYSYLERTPWVVPAGSPSYAHTHIIYNNLRFVLP